MIEAKSVDVSLIIGQKEVPKFPEDPNARFEIVFGAIGNSESECLAALCLERTPQKIKDIRNRFVNVSSSAWDMRGTTLTGYYHSESFYPYLVGFVSSEETDGNSTELVFSTEAAQLYLKPVAAFLLEKAATTKHSFSEIFGQTSKGAGNTSSVINRAEILSLLEQNTAPLRSIDIAKELNLPRNVVGSNLAHLRDLRLVEYSSANTEERYTHTENEEEQFVGSKIQSSAKITPDGTQLVRQLILPIKRALSDDASVLSLMRSANWQKNIAEVIRRAKKHSRNANPIPMEEKKNMVRAIIKEYPGARMDTVQARLGRNPWEVLHHLSQGGQIRQEKDGKAVRYFPVEV